MLTIKILGGGCANCKRLEAQTRKVVEKLDIDAEFIKVTDHNQIMEYPILATPGLVINEKVLSSGRIPSEIEIESWLKAL
ncbi:MAG: thioredoxin family protein [Chloroflexi bacterium HGW-Chloroflexi-2]|jgi:small redox-active disulfide protein 2|nr:MAG: thioredoxin family protein [Chloroflexi bacterium HGW-Chloroflexi-2]